MQPHKEDDNAECCDICGAVGWKETLLTCCICKDRREHAYCMRFNTLKIPRYWVCESCSCVSTSPPEEDQGISSRASKMHQTGKAAKVKSLSEDEVIRLSSGPASCTLLSYGKTVVGSNSSLIPYSNSPVSSSTMELGKHPRDDEIHKKTMTSKHASFPSSKDVVGPPKKCLGKNQRPMGGVTPAKKVQIHDPQKEKPAKAAPFEALSARKSSPIVFSGGTPFANADCNQSDIEKHDQSIQQSLNLDCKFLPCSIATWRGQFQIIHTAGLSTFYDGFEAQPPFIVNRKAFAFSREMPSVLKLESHTALKVLTDIFQDDSPKLQDIALYFFPSEQTERSRKNLNSLLGFMNAEKSLLKSYINGVELLIFTSNQLGMDSRGDIAAVNNGQFLWGFFRKKKIDKTIERFLEMEPVNMVRPDHHLGLVTPKLEFDSNLDVPPGFEELPKTSS
ncbi:PHD finger-containing protein 6-like [Phaseolus vulgaris]|uniref:PHD finger-containing protein 6-like n=1 Tax=Phaseolus vulgaris TaxID=3885 RepID=UPI0035CA26AC